VDRPIHSHRMISQRYGSGLSIPSKYGFFKLQCPSVFQGKVLFTFIPASLITCPQADITASEGLPDLSAFAPRDRCKGENRLLTLNHLEEGDN